MSLRSDAASRREPFHAAAAIAPVIEIAKLLRFIDNSTPLLLLNFSDVDSTPVFSSLRNPSFSAVIEQAAGRREGNRTRRCYSFQ
jgi:hypothetical protein